MTADEIAALPIGTEVLVRVRLLENTLDCDGDVRAAYRRGDGLENTGHVAASAIHSIAPPKPLEVGDAVTRYGESAIIVAVDGNIAWIRYADNGSHSTVNLSHLTRI